MYLIFFLLLSFFHVTDQQNQLCIEVRFAVDGSTVPNAVVHFREADIHRVTDIDGRLCIKVAPGVHSLYVSHLGMESSERRITIDHATEITEISIYLDYAIIRGDEVQITARRGLDINQPGSVSRISREAIQHLQASSLADLFELLPGQLSGTPSLSSPRQSLLRQAPTTSDAIRANALGTGIIVDGSPLSNNANLQDDVTILNSAPGSLPPFASVAGRGTDLREISPDIIQSIEVIQGVPSARYGDITTGAVIVTTRAGYMLPELKVSLNPNMTDIGFSAGFGDGNIRPGYHVAGNITQSYSDPRQNLDRFNRIGLQTGYSRSWLSEQRLRLNARLAAGRLLDERRVDPQDEVSQRVRDAQDQFVRSSLNLSLALGSDRRHRLSFDASSTYRQQRGFYAENITRFGLFPLSDALTDTTITGTFGTTQYRNETTVEGNPLNFYSRFEYRNEIVLGNSVNITLAGVEWKHDSNRGSGRQFDVLKPPRQNYSVGDRPRSFDDIPSLNILSGYAEHRVARYFSSRLFMIQAGLRYDNVSPTSLTSGKFGTVLAPRLNASFEILNDLHIRGAYGKTAKAPPLNFLYPGPRFFDVVNFANFSTDPNERLVIITTAVVEPDNSQMRSYTSDKYEVGFFLEKDYLTAGITGYIENTDGAYGFTRNVHPVRFHTFEAISFPAGSPPILNPEPADQRVFLGAYDLPANTRQTENLGLELDVTLDTRMRAISTIALSGAWVQTSSGDTGVMIDTDKLFTSTTPQRIGIYGRETVTRQRFSTSLRMVHHIPDAGVVVSWLAQALWIDADWRDDVMLSPLGYITREGDRVMIPESQRGDDEYEDLMRRVSDSFLLTERPPPLWLFNVRVSKAFGNNIQASFFVNNVFFSRPLYESRRSGAFVRRNPPLFFGFNFSIRVPHLISP